MPQALASAKRRGAPLTMLAVDADDFKRVNDTFGHAAGDQVLQAIAKLARSRIRESDIAARVGGEEFVLVLMDTGTEGAEVVARDVLEAIRTTRMPMVGHVTVSCGIAEMQFGEDSCADALRHADEALYAAKKSGRDRHHVYRAEAAARPASACWPDSRATA